MKRIIKNVVESSICNRLGRIVRLNSGNLTSVIFIFGSLFRSKPFFLCALCHWYQKMWNFMHTPTQMLKSRFSMFNLHEKGSSLVSLVLFLNDFRSSTIWAFQIQISFPGDPRLGSKLPKIPEFNLRIVCHRCVGVERAFSLSWKNSSKQFSTQKFYINFVARISYSEISKIQSYHLSKFKWLNIFFRIPSKINCKITKIPTFRKIATFDGSEFLVMYVSSCMLRHVFIITVFVTR